MEYELKKKRKINRKSSSTGLRCMSQMALASIAEPCLSTWFHNTWLLEHVVFLWMTLTYPNTAYLMKKNQNMGGKEWKGSLLAFSNQRSRSTCFYCLNTPWNRFHGWWWRNLGNNIIPATISLARFSYHQIEIKINVMLREKKKGKKKKKGKFAAQFLKLKRMKMEKTVKRYTTYIYTYRTYN